MPGPIAAAAGGVLIEKVSDEDSIVNTAFKLTVLIGLALAVAVGVFLIYTLTGVFNDIVNVLEPIATSGSFLGTVFTAIITPTIFGRSSFLARLAR